MERQQKGLCKCSESSKVTHGCDMSRRKTLILSTILSLVSIILSACCVPVKSTQVVDVTPLHLAQVRQDASQINELIDLEIFDTYAASTFGMGNWTAQGDNPDLAGLHVYLMLLADTKSAQESFLWECQRWWGTTDDFIFGGSEDNQYCISYTRTELHTPDGLCLQTGSYESFVVFQKGRLVITIWEMAKDRKSRAKDKAIKLLAEAIKHSNPANVRDCTSRT